MPTTFAQLMLFVTMLTPGLVYTLKRERSAPSRTLSAFRETAEILLVSVIANMAALLLLSVCRVLLPGHTPDVGEIVRGSGDYVRSHYRLLALWAGGLLAASTLLAFLAADGRLLNAAARSLRRPRRTPSDAFASAWWSLFQEEHDGPVHVGCHLDDGSYVAGMLRSFNRDSNDTADRELTLTGPITYRAPGSTQAQILDGVGAAAVSARRITLMTVGFLAGAEPTPVPEPTNTSVPSLP
ncbi:DUF6338 family protein [Streptomyces sp. NPDC056353]|uniref:DUF6338 family protein n=1 Tax=Streptomyces salinarius TaxID=2762598 RepID=A0ABW8B8V6_9ACTN|nr:DUF6338 family protein [Streptomyces sp. BSE6.1]